jgi:hypothetical protein
MTKPESHEHSRIEEIQAKGIHSIFNKNNNRKFPKSRESYAHSGTGSLQDTKQT